MKESMWGWALLTLGIMIISFMLLVQNLTSTSEEDFYLSREVLEASMYDAIDYGTYAKSGKLVMSEAKFVEVFLRRFAESVNNSKDYTINFYDIHEYPPKATVTITTETGTEKILSDEVNINTVTYLNAILESTYNFNDKRKVNVDSSHAFEAGDGFAIGNSKEIMKDSEVTLTFKFMADNDPCGYYIALCTSNDGTSYTCMSRSEDANYLDKTTEYCYATYEKENYFIPKGDLINVSETVEEDTSE